MKKLFFIISFIASVMLVDIAFAQIGGISIGYGTSKAIHGDFLYRINNNSFHIGGTYQPSDTRGKLVSEQKPNYGREIRSQGHYFWSIDAGYGRYFLKKFGINAEISIGAIVDFTNYIDNRFGGGGYYLVTGSEFIGGIGASVNFVISEYITAFGGYNTLRKGTFGLRITSPTSRIK